MQRLTEERNREHDRMMQLQMRSQALQERLEDQSASLKLARESHGDMQERLITAEASFAVKLDSETGKLRQEVLALQERNGLLERSVDECRRQLENQQQLATITISEYETKLKDERESNHSRIQAFHERTLQADLEKTQSIREADDLRNSLTFTESELTTLREQTREIQISLSEWSEQVKDLTMQNHALQSERATLLERCNTISTRYDTNDLSTEEKSFVNRLLEESRSFHEKRIMDKQNELRRRDNQISEQEAKIKSLEKGLARYLKSQDPKFTAKNDSQSILNLSKFTFSSSPPEPIVSGTHTNELHVANGPCVASPQTSLLLETALLEPPHEAQSSRVTSSSVSSGDRDGGTPFSRLPLDSLGNADNLASKVPQAVKLGKHGRPLSQTSQGGPESTSETTRPPRRLVCHVILAHST
ncbi:hypothetical protein B0F90DRAFT_1687302 [Multifurca ochricompacta]|uniref:Uncharacterized protein n=1 Tax=Multifurca ochricompacta TaxID=376703 RepID=A0AAD4QPW4_9AGAM|nr:hypothetical protein B0F90DRAFT_1687302 [Multifurca ochricompacta]